MIIVLYFFSVTKGKHHIVKDVSGSQFNSYSTDYNMSEGILLHFLSITPIFSPHCELLLDY